MNGETHIRRADREWEALCGELRPASSVSELFMEEVRDGGHPPLGGSVKFCKKCQEIWMKSFD